jgi:outer membrane protein assembly factor BamE (lipoprotein component of BamABCDE complex)
MRWRMALPLAMLVLGTLLAGCAAMPERLVAGMPRVDIERALGRPTAVIDGPAGTRLQYSRQPAGQQVFNVELDAQGRLHQVDQVMAPVWFARVEVDRWTRDDVLRLFGRPALVERVALFDGDIWTYRYLDVSWPRQFHVHLDPAGVVRKLMHTDEPMPDDSFDPGR